MHTLFNARCATPQIFATVEAEYNADRHPFAAGLKSKESLMGGGGVTSPMPLAVLLGCTVLLRFYVPFQFCSSQIAR